MSAGPVLIVPACEKGRGGGHLSRSLFLLRALIEADREAYLWIPDAVKNNVIKRFRNFFSARESGPSPSFKPNMGFYTRILSGKDELSGSWDFIVLDRFRTPPGEFDFWSRLGPLIGIDEGGPRRNSFDFLVDLLPDPGGKEPAAEPNLSAPNLLPLPKNRRPQWLAASGDKSGPGSLPQRVLISFGAEDSGGLGVSAAKALSSNSSFLTTHSPISNSLSPLITVIAPDITGVKLPGVRITAKVSNLREHLAEYDLLITHFGLGAFEALYARTPVLLLSPTPYHEKLARNAGFFSLGNAARGMGRLRDLAFDGGFPGALGLRCRDIARRYGLEEAQKNTLASFINGLDLRSPRGCPLCGENAAQKKSGAYNPVLFRFRDETYRRCKSCGVIYLSRLGPPPIEYEKDYFFDQYKKQYGKTYLEDFPNLKETGLKRLVHILKFLSGSGRNLPPPGNAASPAVRERPDDGPLRRPSLLDIGCAYGPFLAAASECGFSPVGLEPAEDAVRYVKEELRFTAWRGFFPDALPGEFRPMPERAGRPDGGHFDVVTLWYVIEHFEEPGKVLREIHRLLKEGGVLAFSTPSFRGVSGRSSLRSFLRNSPPDHLTVWNPFSCRKILKRHGFRVRKITATGHHPERFPLLGRFASPANKNLLYNLLFLLSRALRLGDTFEVYAVKR